MIPLPLILPDTPLALDALEEAVHTWGLAIQQAALARAWQAQAVLRPVVPCPACRSTRQQRAGNRVRTVETSFGPVRLRRARVRCPGCGRHFQPDDAALDRALGAGRCTPLLRILAAQCGASWPYRQAAQVIGMLRGSPLAVETVRRLVAVTGSAVAQQYDREATAACQPPATAPPPRTPPASVAVVLDGAWVHSRDNAHGMEIKVGVVHTGSERGGATRTRLTDRRYAATTAAVATFGAHVTAAIEQVEGFAAAEQTLLGDGAAWIWRLGTDLLPTATQVLDRWHLRDARRRAMRAAVPDKEERRPWSIQVEAALDVGAVDTALTVLGAMMHHHPHPALVEFAGYVRAHAGRIPDYAARHAAGQTIGSGAVEKGVDIVVNRRLKGRRGMRWWRQRAAGVVALRLALLNDEWEQRVADALAA
ncbi:MAG: ISKra4 family transposase [Thermomicrobia bacterium]|nr:ISKra4 family transposase [Thermomicrobia bacterium]